MKICYGCKKEINEKFEKYTHVEDWGYGNIEGESWWHSNCFGKAMNRELTELEKQAITMMQKAGNIYDNLPEEFKKQKEKEFELV